MSEANLVGSDIKGQPPPPAKFEQLSSQAPNFNERLRELQEKEARQTATLEGPIARAQVPMVTLFDSNTPHQPNQTVRNEKYAVHGLTGTTSFELHYGALELHYGANGQPESAHFVDQNGNAEDIFVDKKDPTKMASDTFDYQQIGVTAHFDFKDGVVTRQAVADHDATTLFDNQNGFHYQFQAPEGKYDVTVGSTGQTIEYTALQATRDEHKGESDFVTGERYEYNKLDNGQPDAIVLTRLSGDSYRAVRGPNGDWQVTQEPLK